MLARLCRGNFIGNGSSALVRRQALIDAGGFEPGLRAAGAEQVERHLAAQVGRRHRVLMESAHTGRTEQFAEVRFAAPQPRGRIVTATIAGTDGARLCA